MVHPHPRLLVSEDQLHRLSAPVRLPVLKKAARQVTGDASRFATSTRLEFNPGLHNALLLRAREMQKRIVTLLVRWRQTESEKYRRAAIRDIRAMGAWTYWSWDCEREKNPDPSGDFDLSYGENCATLALAYDWLFPTLSASEKAWFRELVVRWGFRPFLAHSNRKSRAWWFGKPDSNWNTVCAGGAGMLALAFLDEIPDAKKVLHLAEKSIAPYIRSLDATAGGWVEGIGYWNYGHRYAFWYLLSHERATGRRHPLLQSKAVARTLDFPLDFCPHGQPCSFGDVNLWSPLPFHYAAALRLGRGDLLDPLDRLSDGGSPNSDACWPNAAELLLIHPRESLPAPRVAPRTHGWYPGLDWGFLADRFPDPRFYLSIRGGRAGWDTPHSQLDLLSFFCVVGRERLIAAPGINGGGEYLDTTFSSRRYELFETSPASKNTVMINGVGIANPSSVSAEQHSGPGWRGVWLDASQAMGPKAGQNTVNVCRRLFLMIEGTCALILDHVELASAGRMESRFHTFSPVRFGKCRAEILGKNEQLQLLFASSVPSILSEALDAPTTPSSRSTMIRWCTAERTPLRMTMAALLVPGKQKTTLALDSIAGNFLVRIGVGARSHGFRISPGGDVRRLNPRRESDSRHVSRARKPST